MKKLFYSLWNSPSFTSWGNQGAQILRLVLVVPLVLVRFGDAEIAAWFLFSSLLFFGEMINARMDLTFTRMIAFAMGGASDLRPIREGYEARGNGEPNWPLLERVYSTVGMLNFWTALLSAVIAAGMGMYGLQNILQQSSAPHLIVMAFGCLLFTRFVMDVYRRYAIMLKGMNYIALNARWDALFALLSVGAGCVVLSAGGNILSLTLAMQVVALTSLLRMRYFLLHVEDGSLRNFRLRRADKEVLRWASEPFFKGLVLSLANSGVMQLSNVIFARNASVEVVATYLFTLRMLESARQIAAVPFFSQAPRMSRLMAEGALDKLQELMPKRIQMAQGLFVIFALGLMLLGPLLLRAVGAKSGLLSAGWIAVLSLGIFLNHYLIFTLYVSAMANDIVCFKRLLVTGVVSLVSCFVLIPRYELFGLIVAVYIPSILMLGVSPLKIAARRLSCESGWFFRRTMLFPGSAMLVVLGLGFVLH